MVVGGRELWRQRMMVGSGGSKLEIVGCSRFRQGSKQDYLME
jgi:hypothetical protein